MNERDALWADVTGKMSDISPDQLPAYLTLCAGELGSDIVVIDLRKAQAQPEAMQTLAARLNFPDYFGGNLDSLFDVVGERVHPDLATPISPQTWLIKSNATQQKMLFPIADTLRDALSDATGVAVSVLWLVE